MPIYVSKTATNGYQIGVDSNNGASKETPVLTAYKAYTLVPDGGEIIFNDGTYEAADGGNPDAFLRLQKTVTLLPETDWGATIKAAGGGGLTIYAKPLAGKKITLGKIIIDNLGLSGGNGPLYCVPQGSGCAFDFQEPRIINCATRGCTFNYSGAFDITTNKLSISGEMVSSHAIYINAITGGIVNIDADVSWLANYANIISGLLMYAGATNPSVNVKIRGRVTNLSPSGTVIGALLVDTPNAVIDDSDIIAIGVNPLVDNIGLQITAINTNADNSKIINSKVDINAPSCYAIIIGSSSSTGTKTANNGEISGCTAIGTRTGSIATPHGIVMGMGNSALTSGGKVFNNISINFSPNYLAAKCDSTTLFYNNISYVSGISPSISPGGQFMFFKGCNGTKCIKNLMVSDGYLSYFQTVHNHGDGTASVNVEFRNNICVQLNHTNAVFNEVASGNTAVFSNNLYYSTLGIDSTAPFKYQTSSYADIASWITSGHGVDELNADPKLTSDYHLRTDSPCLGAGTKIAGINKDIENNHLVPPYNIGPYGLESGELGVAPVTNDGPPRNNITRLSGTSPTIDPAETYRLDDTNGWRVVTGWTAGTANDFFDADGVPIPFTGQQLIDAGVGPRLYCGSKGIAGYTVDQDAPTNAKIIKILKVPTYIDTLYWADYQEFNWEPTSGE